MVSDFSGNGAASRLYVEDLNGGANHVDIFSETGAYGLWPIGWHGTSLILAKVPACTQGTGLGCCGPLEFHLVDPATAVRSRTIGRADCIIGGPAVPAGAVCETAAVDAKAFDWNGGLHKQQPIGVPASGLSIARRPAPGILDRRNDHESRRNANDKHGPMRLDR